MTIDTIQKLKEVGLFDNFKKAMKILVEETNKERFEWGDEELNSAGLTYNPQEYEEIHDSWISKEYEHEDDYYVDLDSVSLQNASENTETFKSFYCDTYHYDYRMSGLDFGCVKWNMYDNLKGAWEFEGYDEEDSTKYYEYINKVTDISFSCFYGKTPQEILDILNEVK